jgi:hypothetical protein
MKCHFSLPMDIRGEEVVEEEAVAAAEIIISNNNDRRMIMVKVKLNKTINL